MLNKEDKIMHEILGWYEI